jgi:antitoxin ParD1/3/4
MSFIEARVKEGRYNSASGVVSAALRLLVEQELRIDALRTALIDGENSGPPTPFCFDAFIARMRKQPPESV